MTIYYGIIFIALLIFLYSIISIKEIIVYFSKIYKSIMLIVTILMIFSLIVYIFDIKLKINGTKNKEYKHVISYIV